MLARIFPLFLMVCLAASPLRAQSDPFVGQWKLVKSFDWFKVSKASANKYAFNFGGGVETIAIDGTFHPGYGGTDLSVAAIGSHWKVVRKQGGRKLLSAIWTLSKDGNSLTDDFTSFSQNGSPTTTKFLYKRKAAGSGFAGTWVNVTGTIDSVTTLLVRPYKNNGLSFTDPSAGQTLNVSFGPSARRLNARTIEISRKSKGKIAQTREFELSRDLKTMTMTVRTVGQDEPTIYVFQRM